MGIENRHQLIQKEYFERIDWRKNEDVYNFLLNSITGDIPIYLSIHSQQIQVFVASILVPSDDVCSHIDELLKDPGCWGIDITSGYGYGYNYDYNKEQPINPKIYPPFNGDRLKLLSNAIPIFTLRYNPLNKENSAYIELNQQISQPHDLHYIDHLKSYIRLDELGDPDEIVKIILSDKGKIITFKDEVINFHCHLGQYTMLRLFDFTRNRGNDEIELFSNNTEYWNKNYLRGRTGEESNFCYLRGFQIMPQTMSRDLFMDILLDRRKRDYCSFLIHDWKNQRLVEWPSNPDQLGNYFVESDLPYETSPVYFNREVLKKYKDNPDKYEITHSTIDCRGSWGLRYSMNDANQVCAYIKDLSYLPFKEQLHWKSYNEKPKAGLSETTFRRHFLGEWVEDEDPLIDLKKELRNDISIDSTIVWKAPTKTEIEQITYTTSDNQKEWEGDFIFLNKVIVECFNKSGIKKLARKIISIEEQQKTDFNKLGTLKLLKKILLKISDRYESVELIMKPLFEVNDIRSIISSHRMGTKAKERIQSIRTEYGTLMDHQKSVISQLLRSIRLLRNISSERKSTS